MRTSAAKRTGAVARPERRSFSAGLPSASALPVESKMSSTTCGAAHRVRGSACCTALQRLYAFPSTPRTAAVMHRHQYPTFFVARSLPLLGKGQAAPHDLCRIALRWR